MYLFTITQANSICITIKLSVASDKEVIYNLELKSKVKAKIQNALVL